MKLDPVLSRADRVANVVIGVGLVAFAILGSLGSIWARGILAAAGIVMVAGAIGGT